MKLLKALIEERVRLNEDLKRLVDKPKEKVETRA
jgi:hypothetical protein